MEGQGYRASPDEAAGSAFRESFDQEAAHLVPSSASHAEGLTDRAAVHGEPHRKVWKDLETGYAGAQARAQNAMRKKLNKSKATKIMFMVLGYYAGGSFVVISNKQLLTRTGFNFPVSLTAIHMASALLFSHLFIKRAELFQEQRIASKQQRRGVFLLAILFAGTVLCGNASLKYVPVSLTQIVGATTPFFVCLLGYLLFGVTQRWRVYLALLPIMVGAMSATYGEFDLSLLGFALSLASTMVRGLKTVWQGHILQGKEKLDSPNLLKYMAQDAVLILLVLAVLIEGGGLITWVREKPSDYRSVKFLVLILCNPVAAYMNNIFQFMITKHTSPLTLQVVGISRGILTTFTSVLVMRNKISAMTLLGYSVAICGVMWYSEEKRRERA